MERWVLDSKRDSGLMDTQNCTSLGNQLISDSEDLQGKEQCDDSHCEPTDDLHVENEIENNEEAIEEVILGKEFIDVESAYKFYKNYGGKHGFNTSHNHALISTPMKHLLKVNRSISEAQKAHADDAEHSGFSIKAAVQLMSREVGGPENLGFSQKDYMNYIHRKRMSKMEKGDAGAILQYFQKMQSENSSYFYSIQLDEDDMITNIFWADARSVSDCSLFGDVLCFDTTYRTNEYGRPFAPFVGVNYHKQTTLFGAALLYDETTESFIWLFETFLSAMSGKQPMTILTDQSVAMARAIKEVFPQATHRLCVWHFYQNAAKNLSHVFHGSSEFVDDFSNCMYDYEFEHEWLLAWNGLLEKYGLNENKWLNNLFELREKWALVYGRHTFTADMKSTQRSECMNNVLKKYLKPEHNLLRFFEHYERVLADRRYQELIAEYKMIQTTLFLAVSAHMLQHGAEVYTPEVFLLFQKEFVRIHNYSTDKVGKSGMTSEYIVSYSSEHNEHLVKYEASTQNVNCSCKKFTFVGILCVHALKVLDKKNVKNIPPQYILKRWTREAKIMSITSYHPTEIHGNPKESIGRRYGYLCRTSRDILTVAADDEELTRYAHECLVEMLKGLELIKKNRIEKEGRSSSDSSEVNTTFGQSEEVEGIVQSNACETTIVHGVKRKATIGRPRTRFKDPAEKKESKVPKKSTKAPTRRKIPMQEFESILVSLETHQNSEHDVQLSGVLTQDGRLELGTSDGG
ncbi:protein FAR1-RELATED SEQUENCE 5-like [Rosa chinensis]|uniref:protein FAR1-RELATED SEQUENCE 5-like n=1 Tax=Rosa chinensis TaxID=74649 RepID=UPI001AD91B84|nr:protein FAR1-RELATED SEQUENCE 5-like [Rosa chinensis]